LKHNIRVILVPLQADLSWRSRTRGRATESSSFHIRHSNHTALQQLIICGARFWTSGVLSREPRFGLSRGFPAEGRISRLCLTKRFVERRFLITRLRLGESVQTMVRLALRVFESESRPHRYNVCGTESLSNPVEDCGVVFSVHQNICKVIAVCKPRIWMMGIGREPSSTWNRWLPNSYSCSIGSCGKPFAGKEFTP
jgi:hypothetical protein